MYIQKEELDNCQVQLIVEVSAERLQQSMQSAAKKVGKNVRVPGFRPGKAPYPMLLRTVGEQAIMDEAINSMAPAVLIEALEESQVPVFSPDHVTMDLHSLEPLAFRILVPTPPVIKLGSLDNVSVERETADIGEEQVSEVLDRLRTERATMEPSLGPAAFGDEATIDLVGHLMDGTTLEEQKGLEITLAPAEPNDDEPRPTPDLMSQIVGMLVNQIKEVAISFPAEWPEKRVQNRTVLYRVTLLDLKKRRESELNDDFAQEIGEFSTLDELRERIRVNLQAEAEDQAFERLTLAILDNLIDESEMLFPDFLIKDEVQRRVGALERQISTYGLNLENYLNALNQSREELEAGLWDESEEFIRRSLALTEYVREHNLSVTPEEVERELDSILSVYDPNVAASLRTRMQGREEEITQIKDRLVTRKAFFHLFEQVTGETAPPLFPALAEEEASSETTAEEQTAEGQPTGEPAARLQPRNCASEEEPVAEEQTSEGEPTGEASSETPAEEQGSEEGLGAQDDAPTADSVP